MSFSLFEILLNANSKGFMFGAVIPEDPSTGIASILGAIWMPDSRELHVSILFYTLTFLFEDE